MEISLVLNLHDHDGVSHREVDITFDNKASIKQLRNKIKCLLNIDEEHQELYFNGHRIHSLNSTLQQIGVKNEDEIVVRHTLLANWDTYMQHIEQIKALTTSGATSPRKRIAVLGRRHLSPLDDSDFFVAYPSLSAKRLKIDGEINFLVHNTSKYLKRSVEKYFEGNKVEFIDKPKKAAGVQLGYFLNVRDNVSGVCRKFYAKTVGVLPKAEFAPDEKPRIDLIELFVYQLLSLIGLGASEVHFLPDSTNSDCVYLTTALIEGFRMASGYLVDQLLTHQEATKKKPMISKEAHNQLNIITSLLALTDLHENKNNYGIVERLPTNEERQVGSDDPIQELKIVDFRVDVAQGPKPPKTTTATSLKTYFNKWNLTQNIGEAKKLTLENNAIKNSTNVNTPQFETYVAQIEAILHAKSTIQ